MNARGEWAINLWADRCRKLRVILDSYHRRGETHVWARDVAPLLGIPADAVMRMGREFIDAFQVEGIRVTYAGGMFTMQRPKLKRIE